MSLTIDKKYYDGRTFFPVQNVDIGSVKHPPPIETTIGNDGVLCIKFKTGDLGYFVGTSVAPNPVSQSSQDRISSISRKAADFSMNAVKGRDATVKGMVPSGGEMFADLEANTEYYYNVANAKRSSEGGTGGNMRVQFTAWA